MTVLVDANLLVYAALPQAPEHAPARGWLTGVFADDDEVVGLAWSSLRWRSSGAPPWPPTTTASPASADCAGLTR